MPAPVPVRRGRSDSTTGLARRARFERREGSFGAVEHAHEEEARSPGQARGARSPSGQGHGHGFGSGLWPSPQWTLAVSSSSIAFVSGISFQISAMATRVNAARDATTGPNASVWLTTRPTASGEST